MFIMQIDIEGFEYETLSTMTELDTQLPKQIAIEVHTMFPQETPTTNG